MIVECATCGQAFEKKGARTQRKFCSRRCRSRMMNAVQWNRNPNPPSNDPKTCSCGVEFVPVRVTQKWCSAGCRNRHNATARKNGTSPHLLWMRCHGICFVCSGLVDRTLRWPHPGAATVEHIVPLAREGRSEDGNLTISHAACNRKKGTQLLSEMDNRPFLEVYV